MKNLIEGELTAERKPYEKILAKWLEKIHKNELVNTNPGNAQLRQGSEGASVSPPTQLIKN